MFNKGLSVLLHYPGAKAGSYTIPNSVTSIGGYAFSGRTGLTSVTIGNRVTSLEHNTFSDTFSGCTGLTSIAVDPLNSEYADLEGVLFNKDLTFLVHYPGGKAGSYTIPNSVTGIAWGAFAGCTGLTSVTILDNVISIGPFAFDGCTALTGVYIQGHPPSGAFWSPFFGVGQMTVFYYLPGSPGWDSTYADRPTALWLPEVRNVAAGFGA